MPLLIMVIVHTLICGMHKKLYSQNIGYLSMDLFFSVWKQHFKPINGH